MKQIFTVIGARPQFIKAAVLSRFLESRGREFGLRETLVHTGQHYDDNMSEVFFREMGIPNPELNLNIGSGRHGAMTGEMLARLEECMIEQKPDLVLVYGDTNSTLAGALAASKLHIPVAHIEAGLRSYMMAMPEEQNRRLTDHLAAWLFCPTDQAVENLVKEGITDGRDRPSPDEKRVCNVGDIMFEASLYYRKISLNSEKTSPAVNLGIDSGYALLTIHRAENTDDARRLGGIIAALNQMKDREFVFPVHPRTRKCIDALGVSLGVNVHQIEPVGYLDMIRLEAECDFVLTDSGGVQKEAYFFGKPCITMRDTTEWSELVEAGWNHLVGSDTSLIVEKSRHLNVPSTRPCLYGDGRCAEKIAAELAQGA